MIMTNTYDGELLIIIVLLELSEFIPIDFLEQWS